MMGVRYDSEQGRQLAADMAREMRDAAYEASVELAKERGAFPLLDTEQYLQGGFAARLPDTLKDAIREHGIRNSHLTSIRSEEHTSELQSLMRISYAVFCLKKQKTHQN